MDVYSTTELRMREILRKLPPPLDKVIQQANAEAEAEAEVASRFAASRQTMRPFKGAASRAAVIGAMGASRPSSGSESNHGTGAPVPNVAPEAASPAPRRRTYDVEERKRRTPGSSRKERGKTDGRKPIKEKAQVIGNERTMTFASSTALFKGRVGSHRPYPHGMDGAELRKALGKGLRTAHLNAQLREARARKYEVDVKAMADAEKLMTETLAIQPDGATLRLGRLDAAWDGRLQVMLGVHERVHVCLAVSTACTGCTWRTLACRR